jgi:hypothetical protein
MTRSKILVMGVTATGVVAIGLAAGAQRLIVKQDTYLATTGGNVGVGTTTPGAKLHVIAPGGVGSEPIRAQSNSSFFSGFDGSGIQRLAINNDSGPKLNFYGWDTSWFTFMSVNNAGPRTVSFNAGNVGIGTLSPPVKLTLNGPDLNIAGPHIEAFTSADATYPVFQNLNWSHDNISLNFDRYWTGSSWISTSSTGSFSLYKVSGTLQIQAGSAAAGAMVGTTAAIAVTTTGNVGIGTTTPSYTLHVNGTAAGTSWTNLSSRDYKKDVRYVASSEYDQMLAKVVAMKPARYRYKAAYTDDQSVHLGFIAEEMPRDVLSPNGKGVDTYELVTYLAGAVKAQQVQMKTQEARLKAQEEQIAQLTALVHEQAKR